MNTLKRVEQIRKHFDTVTPQQALQNLKTAGFELDAQHVVEKGKSEILLSERYVFDVLDLELIGYVREAVQQRLGNQVTTAITNSGFYQLLHEDPIFVHHFDVRYWADFVVDIYFTNHKGTVQEEKEENLVEQAIELWQRLRDDEEKYWQFKMRQKYIIECEAKEAHLQFVKLEATYKEAIGLLLKKGKTIADIAELLDASEIDIREIANRNQFDY